MRDCQLKKKKNWIHQYDNTKYYVLSVFLQSNINHIRLIFIDLFIDVFYV